MATQVSISRDPRPIYSTLELLPPMLGLSVSWDEHLSSGLAWSQIRMLSEVPEKGTALFNGTRKERHQKWEALNDFARQAQAYYQALELTDGTSRGLLGYYCALNLAKAELLHHYPDRVVNRRIGHGVTFPVGKFHTIFKDELVVQPSGVFPLLYEARTGRTIANGTKLSVKRLLGQIPEIGQEYLDAFSLRTNAIGGWLRIAFDGAAKCWPLMALTMTNQAFEGSSEFTKITKKFAIVNPPPNWKALFGNIRTRSENLTFLESKEVFDLTAGQYLPIEDLHTLFISSMGSTVENAKVNWYDFTLCMRPYKSKDLLMPSFLARYLVIYYLSSLVRYQPSRLNPNKDRLVVWLLEAFARQSPVRLLADGWDGITQRSHNFMR